MYFENKANFEHKKYKVKECNEIYHMDDTYSIFDMKKNYPIFSQIKKNEYEIKQLNLYTQFLTFIRFILIEILNENNDDVVIKLQNETIIKALNTLFYDNSSLKNTFPRYDIEHYITRINNEISIAEIEIKKRYDDLKRIKIISNDIEEINK